MLISHIHYNHVGWQVAQVAGDGMAAGNGWRVTGGGCTDVTDDARVTGDRRWVMGVTQGNG